jgi:hypothetical protein
MKTRPVRIGDLGSRAASAVGQATSCLTTFGQSLVIALCVGLAGCLRLRSPAPSESPRSVRALIRVR